MSKSFNHDETIYTDSSAEEIVPILIKIFQPSSVIDIGCGIGNFLHVFIKKNITDVKGLDGNWVSLEVLNKSIPIECFIMIDLENEFSTFVDRNPRQYDLLICLEVAEHLSQEKASEFIDNICRLSSNVIFSAAIPYQGGENHINEQWPTYWKKLFNNNGYSCHDIIRPMIWDNSRIHWWYKQNILFFKKNIDFDSDEKQDQCFSLDLIHPENYLSKAKWIDEFRGGDISWGFAFFLFKNFILKKIKWKK